MALAESLLDEIRVTTAATGIPAHRYVEIWVAALRGREPELSALVEDFTTDAKARGEGFALAFAGHRAATRHPATRTAAALIAGDPRNAAPRRRRGRMAGL